MLVAVTPEVTNFVAGAWRDLPLGTPVALAAGTYWIGVWSDTNQDGLTRAGQNRHEGSDLQFHPRLPRRAHGDRTETSASIGGAVRPVCGVYTPATAVVATLASVSLQPFERGGWSELDGDGNALLSGARGRGGGGAREQQHVRGDGPGQT